MSFSFVYLALGAVLERKVLAYADWLWFKPLYDLPRGPVRQLFLLFFLQREDRFENCSNLLVVFNQVQQTLALLNVSCVKKQVNLL